jgi:hypothetical protein
MTTWIRLVSINNENIFANIGKHAVGDDGYVLNAVYCNNMARSSLVPKVPNTKGTRSCTAKLDDNKI